MQLKAWPVAGRPALYRPSTLVSGPLHAVDLPLTWRLHAAPRTHPTLLLGHRAWMHGSRPQLPADIDTETHALIYLRAQRKTQCYKHFISVRSDRETDDESGLVLLFEVST